MDVETYIPLENPFTYQGTAGSWDEQELHQAFVKASVIEVEMPTRNRVSPLFNINPSGAPATEHPHSNETWSLKMTKVGVLNRKDDMMEGGMKSSNRKWKAWSVILTGSQLLFFRDPGWASALSPNSDSSVEFISPPSNLFKPDESFSLKDTLAVYDLTYTKVRCLHAYEYILNLLVILQSTTIPLDFYYPMAASFFSKQLTIRISTNGYPELIMLVHSNRLESKCDHLGYLGKMYI